MGVQRHIPLRLDKEVIIIWEKGNVVPCIVNDGFRTQDEMFRIVKNYFI